MLSRLPHSPGLEARAAAARGMRDLSPKLALLALTVIFLAPSLESAVIVVPSDAPSIQAAIDAASPGDVVSVAPGTYVENLDFGGKAVTVESADGPEVTVIDGSNCTGGVDQCSVVVFVSGEGPDSVLRGFTITGGTGTLYDATHRRGGGIFCHATSPTIENCTVTANSAYNGGGISAYLTAAPRIHGCWIQDNSATNCAGGIDSRNSSPEIVDCSILNNSAVLCGGGIGGYVGGAPVVTNSTISGNSSDNGGGGLHFHTASSSTITNCVVTFNTAGTSGGGMSLSGGGPHTVTDCVFADNVAGATGGAGICSRNITLTRCEFRDNTAEDNAGAVQALHVVQFIHCSFIGNSAGEDGGAATSLSFDEGSPSFVNCLMAENTAAGDGGAIYFNGTNRISNCTITRNTANRGGAISLESGLCRMVNSIATDNVALDANPQLDGSPAVYLISYSNIQGGFAGEGNIDADPLFVDPTSSDYRLQPGSPCIDAGDLVAGFFYPAEDLDGSPRTSCFLIDMGAYEFITDDCGFVRGDANVDDSIDIADAISVLAALFTPGMDISCADAADANDDGAVDIADSISILDHLFGGATAPFPDPAGSCGPDPTADALGCQASPNCVD